MINSLLNKPIYLKLAVAKGYLKKYNYKYNYIFVYAMIFYNVFLRHRYVGNQLNVFFKSYQLILYMFRWQQPISF
jgi:hypothetical protein